MSIQERRVHPKTQPRRPRPKNPGEAKTRKLVSARSGGWCEVCGVARAESVHHRRKRSQGGPWSASNCVDACGDGTGGCHGWAEGSPNAAAAEGFHLRPGQVPSETLIVSGLHGHVLLTDTGSIRPAGDRAA
ncbi:HNH endonuclease signature motif containing protein [Micromonospora sp. NPDC048169]|uniref:HNH endonuclease n=1 Tax=Micromonospora sp. NPDC048169 TaxID=3154711 RepID=UPI0033D07C4C